VRATAPIRSAWRIAASPGKRAWLPLLFALTAIAIISPLAVIDLPLLADYPNHVARIHIINNLSGEIFLTERFHINLDFLPNMAMDYLLPWLATWFSLDIAARLFTAICLLTSLASVAILHRTLFDRWSSYPLLAVFFVHHASFLAGLLNFSLGIALVPAALALWIKLDHAKAIKRLMAGVLITLLLYACHLVAFGAYGLLVLGYEWRRACDRWRQKAGLGRTTKDMAVAAGTGFLPVLLFLHLIITNDQRTPISLADDEGAGIVYGNLAWKLKALLAPLAQYNLPLDLITFAALTSLAIAAWHSGWIKIERRIAPGLLLLAIAFLLSPKALWTGGVFDQRFAVLLGPMMIACSNVTEPRGLASRLVVAMLTGLFLTRLGVLTAAWHGHQGDLQEMRAIADSVEYGSRVLVALPDEGAGLRLSPERHRVFHHAAQLHSLPTLLVIEKSAFVSTIYAIPGQHPLILKPPFDRLGGRGPVKLPTLDALREALNAGQNSPLPPQIQSWAEDFDYVLLLYGYGRIEDGLVKDLPLAPLLDGDIMDLFRIEAD